MSMRKIETEVVIRSGYMLYISQLKFSIIQFLAI